jgi:hypothetical protein
MAFFVPATPAHASATTPFACSPTMYQVSGSQLKKLNITTKTYDSIGTNTKGNYNAIGYNQLDNMIYGISTAAATNSQLVRVSGDGTVTILGKISGLPVATYTTGTMDNAGNLWLPTLGTSFWKVNVSTRVATSVKIESATQGSDVVFMDGVMYSLRDSTLYRIATGTSPFQVSSPNVSGLPSTGVYGSAWRFNQDALYFSLNTDGSIYRITNYTGTSPKATKVISALPAAGDGASCPKAGDPFGWTPPTSPTTTPTTQKTTVTTKATTPTTQKTTTSTTDPCDDDAYAAYHSDDCGGDPCDYKPYADSHTNDCADPNTNDGGSVCDPNSDNYDPSSCNDPNANNGDVCDPSSDSYDSSSCDSSDSGYSDSSDGSDSGYSDYSGDSSACDPNSDYYDASSCDTSGNSDVCDQSSDAYDQTLCDSSYDDPNLGPQRAVSAAAAAAIKKSHKGSDLVITPFAAIILLLGTIGSIVIWRRGWKPTLKLASLLARRRF